MRTPNPVIAQTFCWWLCGLLRTSFVALYLSLVSYTNLFNSVVRWGISLPNLFTYTTLSTLFDWLWMWDARVASQSVCD